jgi:hypothetical protein
MFVMHTVKMKPHKLVSIACISGQYILDGCLQNTVLWRYRYSASSTYVWQTFLSKYHTDSEMVYLACVWLQT